MSAVMLSIFVVMDFQAFCYLCLLILHYTDGCAVSMVTFLSNRLHRFRRPPATPTPPVNVTVFVSALWINSLNCMLTQPAVNSAVCEVLAFC